VFEGGEWSKGEATAHSTEAALMGVDVMFPKCDGCYRVSWRFADFLNDALEDFSIRYGVIEASPRVRRRLRRLAAGDGEDAEVAQRMLEDMNRDGAVELFVSA
jgi:plasmid rolling circle replication initiator protein Rep